MNSAPTDRSNSIAIVDYGMGNLRSVQKALERLGHVAHVTNVPEELAAAPRVVLPGVGAFRDAMAELRRRDLVEPIRQAIASGKPVLGICLGLQLLFDTSYEDGTHEGLGILRGEVVRFGDRPGLKIPHMGWNELLIRRPAPILRGVTPGAHVYFVHSYHVVPADRALVAAESAYPDPFVAMIWRDNLFACQFHPEKSQAVGLTILRNFAEYEPSADV